MHAIEENKPGLSQPFSINQTGTLLTRHLAHFVSAIDTRRSALRQHDLCLTQLANNLLRPVSLAHFLSPSGSTLK